MSVAVELAKRVQALQYEDLPPEAVYWAKVGVLDTVGVTLAGASEPAARILADTLASGTGPALVFGAASRVPPLDAALINGTASHALDFDDCNNTLGGHPSAPVLPALFALADSEGASGREFIAAYVAGFLKADKLVLLTDVAGLLLNGQLVPKLNAYEARELLPQIGPGMITKIYASLEALEMGVDEVIITSGLIEKPISSAIENTCGTVIRRG